MNEMEIPPGLKRSTPREVELTAGGRTLTALAFAMLIGATVAGVAMDRTFKRQAEARQVSTQEGIATKEAPPRWVPWFVASALASGGLGVLLVVRMERQLLETGRVARGVVLAHHVHHTSHGGKHRSMRYEFQLLSGAKMIGKNATSSKPPAIGSALTVIYDPERPRRSRPYPFQFARPARS